MKRSLPWLEIVLSVVLVAMILIGVNAIFGADIQGGIGDFCTANSLWCAPPTPTPTSTPTPTPTPRPTRTSMPTAEFTPTGVFTPADTSTPTPTP